MKRVRISGKGIMYTLLVAGLMFKAGCGNPFLGLEDYQRDLAVLGLLAAVLMNDQADTGSGSGDGDAGRPVPTVAGAQAAYEASGCVACHCADASGGCADDAPPIVGLDATLIGDFTEAHVDPSVTELTNETLELITVYLNTVGREGPQGPQGPEGLAGPEGPTGPAGADGQDGAPGADGQDGAPGADGQDGVDGQDGADGSSGSSGSVGPAGPEGPAGSTFFDIFIDDFFVDSDPNSVTTFGDLPVNIVSIEEPGIGAHELSGTVGPVAFRVAIPQNYDAGNDITMRLFLHRTGPIIEQCQVMTIDTARLAPGTDVVPYGSRRWLRVDLAPLGSPTTRGENGTPVLEGYLVVDLPINSISPVEGLGPADPLAVSDFLAFELATYSTIDDLELPWDFIDGGLYHLLGVEFFESAPGDARMIGVTLTDTEPAVPCGSWDDQD